MEGGNFGVGTSTPETELDVAGKITAQGIILTDGTQVTLQNIPPVSKAPSSDNLEVLVIDPTTGLLYHQ